MASTIHTIVALFFCPMFWSCKSQMISSNFFEESDLCDVEERVDRGCSFQIPNTRSRLECYTLCERDMSCIGASLDPNGLCFHHKECPMLSGCTIQNHEHRFMTKYCAHGTWDMTTESCQCVDGFFGDRCKHCPQNCHDLILRNYPKGEHRVYIDPSHNGQKPFMVLCNINYPPSSRENFSEIRVFQNSGVHDFNKTWVDYVNGFYYDDGDFWLGLYPLYRICKSKTLFFIFRFLSRHNIPYVYRVYKGVTLSNESSGYMFTFSSSRSFNSNNVPQGAEYGECLEPLKNVPFSTWDSDHDGNADENCAANAGSGWWYKGCDNSCNALGFGLKHSEDMLRKRIMSLKGVDTDSMASEEFRFELYLREQD